MEFAQPVVDVAIMCSDFEASLHFYHECLGLKIVHETNISDEAATKFGLAPRGFHQVRVRAGETVIKLMKIASPPPAPEEDLRSGVRWLSFYLKDIRETVGELKEKGVAFRSEPAPPPDPPGLAVAQGPDGVLIEFLQR